MVEISQTRHLLHFATDIAWQAGRLTLAYFQTGVPVERKSDRSEVTIADRQAEELLRQRIRERFPEHGILGEEFGSVAGDGLHRWILDPIDGTRAFVRGVPLFGTLVALEIEGVVVVGVAYFPALDEMVSAGQGLGCHWNGRRAQVSAVNRLDEALVVYTDGDVLRMQRPDAWRRLREAARVSRGWGDAYGHCLVATGRAEVAIDPRMHPWDNASLFPILHEAGGSFTDWGGDPTIYGECALSTNGQLRDAVLQVIRGR